ncbi:MAG: hypothetical protein N3H30_00680 [Candidatus Micrarchaeota archaeon]|nr:hypothetical protein [Candidatus Micrarchaeota archaeon]
MGDSFFVARNKPVRKLAERFTANIYEFHRCKVIAESDGLVGLCAYSSGERDYARLAMRELSQENFIILKDIESRPMLARQKFRDAAIEGMHTAEGWQITKSFFGQLGNVLIGALPAYVMVCIITAFEEAKALTGAMLIIGSVVSAFTTAASPFMKGLDDARNEVFETLCKMRLME